MAEIGWHFQGPLPGWAGRIVNATWNKVMDPGNVDPLPGRQTVGRTYVDDQASNELVAAGAHGAETWFAANRQAYERAPWVAAWEGPNEPPVATSAQRRALAAFTTRLGELLHGIGRKHVGLNLSVGWTDIGTAPELGPCLAACDYVGLHEYGAPTMQSGEGWYCLRYRRTVNEWQTAGFTVPPLLMTELGIDGGVIGRPRTGWRSYCSEEEYARQLAWYLGETRNDRLVAGMMVFTSSPLGWDDFEVGESLSKRIAAVNAAMKGIPVGVDVVEKCVEIARPLPRGVGTVSQVFGDNVAVYAPLGFAGHEGLDYACKVGSSVLACAPGRVAFAGERKNHAAYGRHVVIEHGKYRSWYCHMSALDVRTGETVAQGQRIGASGNTGRSTGPHLHFAIQVPTAQNGSKGFVDPWALRVILGDA